MITIAERAKNIRHAIAEMVTARGQWSGPIDHMADVLIRATIAEAVDAAINDKLEEVAIELQKLERGVYTTAQTPAGLVRAMKVR